MNETCTRVYCEETQVLKIQVIMDLTKNYVLLLGIYREKVINLMVFYERTKRVTTI